MNHSTDVAEYPPPPGRTAHRPLKFLVAIVVALPVFAGFAIYLAVGGMWTHNYYRAFVGLALGASTALTVISRRHAALASRQRRPDMTTVQSRGGQTCLTGTREALVLHTCMVVTLSITGFSVAIGMWTGWGDLPATEGQKVFLPPGFAIWAAAGLVDAVATLVTFKRGPVLLTPTEIRRNQYYVPTTMRWQSVDGVEPGSRLAADSRGLVLLTRKHHGAKQFQGSALGIGVPAFYWLMDFYLRHPELRGELADERAAERIRNGSIIGRTGWIAHG